MKNNQQPKDITYQKIAWTIRNFKTLKTNTRHYSEVFTIGDCNWKVCVYRGRQDGKFLAIYLYVADASSLPQGWSIYADFTFTVLNQLSRDKSAKGDIKHKFSAHAVNRGYSSFMPLRVLQDPSSGFISNDNCVVEVEFYAIKPEGVEPATHLTYPSLSNESKQVPANELPKDEHLTHPSLSDESKQVPASELPKDEPATHLTHPSLSDESKQVPANEAKVEDDDALVDFKGLGRIEKPYVPLLEEVCLWHPSLMDGKKNRRSRRFMEWALNGLGQVLQFLKDKKWRDMNDEACEQLEYLWEELEMSRLELGWLEPTVKSALKMKGYEEKAEKVKKLKETLMALETEMKELKEKLDGSEQSVEMIRKDLANVEDGFEEKDLEAEIGYGKP